MTRPADIPVDVWAIAEAAAGNDILRVKIVAARAVLADRFKRTNIAGLTSKQAACLQAIADHQAKHGVSPTLDELKDAMGLASKSGVQRLLLGLEKRGRILRPANRSRAITIIATPTAGASHG